MLRSNISPSCSQQSYGRSSDNSWKKEKRLTRRCSRQSRLHFCPLRLRSVKCVMGKYGQASAPAAKRYVMLENEAKKMSFVHIAIGH